MYTVGVIIPPVKQDGSIISKIKYFRILTDVMQIIDVDDKTKGFNNRPSEAFHI